MIPNYARNVRRKLVKCYIRSTDFYSVEIWTLQIIEQKYLGSFEMWGWRRLVGPTV
jgi:hypothetical protein